VSESAGAKRVFLALPLPSAARGELARLTEAALTPHAAHLRLVDPAGYHATVHFFGALATDELNRARALCGQVVEALAAPLRCAVAGLAQLPARGPARVVHAEFGDGRGALAAFLTEARERIAAAAFPVPARSPLPHVTVARVRRGRRWRLADPVAVAGVPFVLDQLVLFESHLHPSGARYVPLTSARPAAG
jgi:2'-5' RNA ligase